MDGQSVSAHVSGSPRRATLIWCTAAALVLWGLLLIVTRLPALTSVMSDFTYDYISGRALNTGRSIYQTFTGPDFSAQAMRMSHDLVVPEPVENIHPPFAALVFVPFALLPYDLAALLWSLLSLLGYLAIIWMVLHTLELRLAGHWLLLLLGLLLCWQPFQSHMALGQISLLLASGMVGAWALLRRGHAVAAGVLIGLACLIKLFPGMLLLWLLLRRRWRALAAALVTLALGAVLVWLVVGPADLVLYARQVAPRSTLVHGTSPINLSLTGLLYRLFLDGNWVQPLVVAPGLATALTVLLGLALVTLLAWQTLRLPGDQRGDDRAFGMACLAMLLLSPITWQHILPVLLPTLGLLLYEALRLPNRRQIGLGLLALLLLSLPDIDIARGLMALFAPYRMPWPVSLVLLAPTLGLALLWYLLVTLPTQRSGRIATDTRPVPHT